jgi:quercetin dioxygenase-like cupin family protein
MARKPTRPAKAVAVDLEAAIEFAADGIVSKTLLVQPGANVSLFCMAAGQALTEHTASWPAAIHVLRGSGTVRLGRKNHQARPGSWYYMPKGLLHAVRADEDFVFLLTLFR